MIIDVKPIEDRIYREIRGKMKDNIKDTRQPGLIVFSDMSVDANRVYVGRKKKKCAELGFGFRLIDISEMDSDSILWTIRNISYDFSHYGMMLQLPAPKLTEQEISDIQNAIPSDNDVDGLGMFSQYKRKSKIPDSMIPCTPSGIMEILDSIGIDPDGERVVIVGRSQIVGLPLAELFIGRDATVTLCHSHTKGLSSITRQADILVSAVGKSRLIDGSMVKPGAVVIDVGINRDDQGKLCGDCDTLDVDQVAAYVTPVPGGVGRMTVACLMRNVMKSYELFKKRK